MPVSSNVRRPNSLLRPLMDLSQIRFLESVENIKALASRRTGRELSTARAREITACLQQGRLFFEAAPKSPLETRPLVQFYGLLGFARALILARRSVAMSTLAKGHGIKDISTPDARIVELKAKIESRGTFVEFNDEVGAINRACYFGQDLQPKSVLVPTASSNALIATEVSLKDVLARIPGLGKMYRNTFNEAPHTEYFDALNYRSDEDYFSLRIVDAQVLDSRDALGQILNRWRARFPCLAKWRVIEATRAWGETYVTITNLPNNVEDELGELNLRSNGSGGYSARIIPTADVPRQPLAEILDGIAGGYSDSGIHGVSQIGDHYLSEFSLIYIGLFLLSSLVRYRPDIWSHAVSRSSLQDRPMDDQALALIEQFLEISQPRIPAIVVSLINPNEDRYA